MDRKLFPGFPDDLDYIAELAARLRLRTVDESYDYADSASEAQLEELASVAERMRLHQHANAVRDWMTANPMPACRGAVYIYFLMGAMDAACFGFD